MTAAVTFDFHNTLVRCDRWFELEVRTLPATVHRALTGDTATAIADDLTEAYRGLRAEIIAHGRELDAVDGVIEAFRRVGFSIEASVVSPIINSVMTEALDEAELMPGALPSVRFLRSHHVPLGVVSSAVHHPFLEWALKKFMLADAFDVVVSSARAGFYKSRREIYDLALEALGATANQSVHVGDSYRFDHLAGREIGLATVWLRDPASVEGLNGSSPDLELTTMEGAGPAILELFHSRRERYCAD